MKINQKGFTLLEILVMAPVLMITIVFLMSFLFNQYGQLTQQGAQISLQLEAQNISFSAQDDVFFAQAFVSSMNDNLEDTYAPSGGWSYNTTPQTFIISSPALTKNHRDANREPVYIDTNGCSPQEALESNSVLYNNIIYFVSGTNLYKRIITAPASMPTCGTSFQSQTCPAAQSSSSCPPDRLLTDKLNSFTVTYYDTDNAVVSVPEAAEKVKIDFQLKDRAFAEDVFASSTITLKKLNQ